MKKRILTLALVLCLAVSLAAPALAAEESGYRVARISDGRAMYLYSFLYDNGGTLPTAVDCTYSGFDQTMSFNAAGQITKRNVGSAESGLSTYAYAYDGGGNMQESLEESINAVQKVTVRTANVWEGGLRMRTLNEHSAEAVNGSDAPEFITTVTDVFNYDGGVCTGASRTTVFDGEESQTDVAYENDANGRPLRLTYSTPGWEPSVETFSYDEQGRVLSHTDTMGYVYDYTYAGPVQVEVMQIPLPADDPEYGGEIWNVSIQMADKSGTVYFSDSVQTTGAPSLAYDENGLLTAVNCDFNGDSFTVAIEYETIAGAPVNVAVAMPDDGYVVPTALGTDPLSMIFELDGGLYQLPAPYAAFAANGLELLSVPDGQTIEPGESAQFELGRSLVDQYSASVRLHNYGTAPAAPEECYVVSVSVHYITDGSSRTVIPEANGGIRSGMDLEALEAIIAPSPVLYYYSDKDDYGQDVTGSSGAAYRDYKAYMNEEDGETAPDNYNIWIEYSYAQDAVDLIQIRYEPAVLPY